MAGIEAFTTEWPGRLVFGPGKLAEVGNEARSFGKRAFLVTTRDLVKLGWPARVCDLLQGAGIDVRRYDDVEPDPTCVAVDAAAAIARRERCDFVVGLGGGSAIDFAKGVAVAATHPGSVWDYVTYTGADAKPVTPGTLPIVAIPTTAGTGAEVTHGTVLDNPERVMKAALLSPHVYPKLALVDPELTRSMPTTLTAMTGFDALSHGMEAFLNASRRTPLSDLYALETVELVMRHLPRALARPDDMEARAGMAWAATLGGMSIAHSNTTVAHAMGLPMGARLSTPHGLALSRLLPVVLTHSWQAQPERFAMLADALGIRESGSSDEACARELGAWIAGFVEAIGLTELWREQKIERNMVDRLTYDVLGYMGRPVQQHQPVFSAFDIRRMYEEALFG